MLTEMYIFISINRCAHDKTGKLKIEGRAFQCAAKSKPYGAVKIFHALKMIANRLV